MNTPAKTLSLFDSVCIIVGIIIGVGVYETTPLVAACMGGWVGVVAVWLVGGVFALCGALCYAELATTYPDQGGDYVYLSRAYGRWAGFLFGWSQLAIIRPGDIALMAFIFARYATTLYAPFSDIGIFYAAGAVVLLTLINILGVRESKGAQNTLTVLKVVGLLFVVILGFLAPGCETRPAIGHFSGGGIKLAMILVLFTYGGWNEMAYVAAEIRAPERNIFRALVLGTVVVALIYLLVNWAFLHALGYEGLAASEAVAVDVVATMLPDQAERWVGVLICISALGAINGMIFTGSRISYALGTGHRIFKILGKWNPRLGTPVAALVLQGLISLGIVLLAGSFVDTILYSAPAVWIFFLATGLAVFRLRRQETMKSRPCRVVGYPATPIVFCSAAAFMLYNAFTYALSERPVGLLLLFCMLLAGSVVYGLTNRSCFTKSRNL